MTHTHSTTVSKDLLIDRVATTNHLKAVASVIMLPNQVYELRAINGKQRGGTDSGYFNTTKDLIRAALAYCDPANVLADALYLTPNPVDPRLLARSINRVKRYAKATTADADILRRRFIFVDIDPIRPAGISATNEEHAESQQVADAILDFLTNIYLWPEPALAGTSGNGAFIWYRVDLPNDDDSNKFVRGFLNGLAAIYTSPTISVDTTVCNAARIMKLPGTIAAKGDHLIDAGQPDRPWRQSWAHIINPKAGIVTAKQLAAVESGL